MLVRQWLAGGFEAEGRQQQTQNKRNRGERNGNADGVEVRDARTDEKCEARADEAPDRCCKREGGAAAFRRILLGQP